MNFKVGDRVKVREWKDMKKEFGTDCFGSIKCEYYFATGMKKYCGKEFIVEFVGNNSYTLKNANCWDFTDDMLYSAKSENKILITVDGDKTLARLYENNKIIKTAEARCYPEDEFDFETGAKLAFERLFEIVDKAREPKYNAKIVPIEEIGFFSQMPLTIGKIYEVVDGIITYDNGCLSTIEYNSKNLEMTGFKFIEIVEDC